MKVCHPDGKTLLLDWNRDRIFDKEVAQVFLTLVKQHDSVRYFSSLHTAVICLHIILLIVEIVV